MCMGPCDSALFTLISLSFFLSGTACRRMAMLHEACESQACLSLAGGQEGGAQKRLARRCAQLCYAKPGAPATA